MEETGFCTSCHQEVSTAGSTVIRESPARALIIGADRRAHSLVFGKVAERVREGAVQEVSLESAQSDEGVTEHE